MAIIVDTDFERQFDALMFAQITGWDILPTNSEYLPYEFLEKIKDKEVYVIGGQYEFHVHKLQNHCSKVTVFLDENDANTHYNSFDFTYKDFTVIVQSWKKEWMNTIKDETSLKVAKILYNVTHATARDSDDAFMYGVMIYNEQTVLQQTDLPMLYQLMSNKLTQILAKLYIVVKNNKIKECIDRGMHVLKHKKFLAEEAIKGHVIKTFNVEGSKLKIAMAETSGEANPQDVKMLAEKTGIAICLRVVSPQETVVTLAVHDQHLNLELNAGRIAKKLFAGRGTKSFATGTLDSAFDIEKLCFAILPIPWLTIPYIDHRINFPEKNYQIKF